MFEAASLALIVNVDVVFEPTASGVVQGKVLTSRDGRITFHMNSGSRDE